MLSPSDPWRSPGPGPAGPPSRAVESTGMGARLSPISAEGDLRSLLKWELGLSAGWAEASPNLKGDRGRDWEKDRLCSWDAEEAKAVAGDSGRLNGEPAWPEGNAGGLAACREGSVMDPRRWFWRNSRGARGVTWFWRAEEEEDVLGGRAPPAGLPFGESGRRRGPPGRCSPSEDEAGMEERETGGSAGSGGRGRGRRSGRGGHATRGRGRRGGGGGGRGRGGWAEEKEEAGRKRGRARDAGERARPKECRWK